MNKVEISKKELRNIFGSVDYAYSFLNKETVKEEDINFCKHWLIEAMNKMMKYHNPGTEINNISCQRLNY